MTATDHVATKFLTLTVCRNEQTKNMLYVACLVLFVPSAIAFPIGAGACPGGMAAAFGAHLEGNGRVVLTGDVTAGDVEVVMDGTSLAPGAIFNATATVDHKMTVKALDEKIRGILIRMESSDGADITGGVTSAGDMIDEAQQCTLLGTRSIYGIDHNSNEQKDSVSVTFNIPELMTIVLDLTVVMANNLTHSIHYYSNYSIDVADFNGDDAFTGKNESCVIDGSDGMSDHNETIGTSSDVQDFFRKGFLLVASATALFICFI